MAGSIKDVISTRHRKAVLCSLAVLAAPAANQCDSKANKPLPCDVDTVLRQRCQACHASTPQYGAPMPLTTMDDILAASKSSPSSTVAQRIKARINDPVSPMPPKGQTPLKDAELATLNSWLDAGTPAGTDTCQNLPPPGDLNALTGPAYLPCTPSKYFQAHATNSTAKYTVGPSGTNTADYRCFSFANPFGANEHATAWAPIIDETRVIHHWLLFGANAPASATSGVGCQLAVTNALVAGWAPGGSNAVMEPDVSLQLSFPYYILQVHYVNQTGTSLPDSSGVAFCTGAPRTNVAGMVTLGTNNISIPPLATATATGVCNDSSTNSLALDNATPMTVISTSPHMHLTGTSFITTHAGHPDLSNIPDWNFDVQIHYPLIPRRVVMPGEKLTTTCTYKNPTTSTIGFGPGTTQEMCYDFIAVYPYSKARIKCGPTL